MVATIFLSVCVFAALMAMMALGLLLNGRQLRGSCGGNPESANCGCSPEKKATCREKFETQFDSAEEGDVFSGPPLTSEHLAPPGERRLVQLRTGRR